MTSGHPDPDLLLRQVAAGGDSRGRLKVFLGYGAGAGKSFRMLDEGRRRAQRGQDVVVGAVQARYSPEVRAVLASLERIPMLAPPAWGPVINLPALLHRRPEVCLIDGLAFANPPSSEHPHRWQDVAALLEAGISVLATINLQFIAERRAEVERIAGKRLKPADLVPESFLRAADEIELVDAPAPEGDSDSAAARLIPELRELALLLAADVVDAQLEAYLRRHGLEFTWGAQERILVCLGGHDHADSLLASGRRNADRFHGELIAAHVADAGDDASVVHHNLERARALDADTVELPEQDFTEAISRLAQQRGVTQIYLGHARQMAASAGWWPPWARGRLEGLLRRAEGMDLRIFPRAQSAAAPRPAPGRWKRWITLWRQHPRHG